MSLCTVEGTVSNCMWKQICSNSGEESSATEFMGYIKSEIICERVCVVLEDKTFGLIVCERGLMYCASSKDRRVCWL
jgi:hypothetical protein